MRKINLFLFLFLIPIVLLSQRSFNHKLVDNDLYPAEAVRSFDLRERTIYKQVFYNENWVSGFLIDIKGKVIEQEFLLKYDVLNQELNVSISGKVYVVPTKNLSGFTLKSIENGFFVNQLFLYEKAESGIKHKAFFEVIEKGKYQLLINHTIDKLKPNYVPALDAGSLSEKIIKKDFYYLKDEKGIYQIPKKRKAANKFFQSYPKAKRYLKKNKVNSKKLKDLQKLVQFINQETNNYE